MPNVGKIVALHSNDIVFLAWRFQKEILDCLGFTVRRRDLNATPSTFQPLPAWVGWEGGTNENWEPKNTDIWPVQKFTWRDLTAERGHAYQYEVIPMTGSPDSLQPEEDLMLKSDPITLTPQTANHIDAYFNNGILSTQHVSHLIPPGSKGVPNYQKLLNHIRKPGDTLRDSLAGQMIEALLSLLRRAQGGGKCYAALYELDDEELIEELIKTKDHLELILSTAGTDDATNKPTRHRLKEAGVNLTNRMLNAAHIGHNKFVVYEDAGGTAQAVLAGSTNWTSTGLCAQSNNSILITDPEIAGFYKQYWQRIKDDTEEAGKDTTSLQGETYRKANDDPNQEGKTTIWFSPNTTAKSKPKGVTLDKGTPDDLSQVFDAIRGAKQAILFLEFQPGSPSVLDVIKEMEQENPKLFIRGAATDPKAIEKFDDKHPITTELYHRSASDQPDVVYETGVAATAINDEFAYWKKELLKSSPQAHAIIHDKIVVIDPLSETDCVVITGSHNHGYKASYCNDENLLILRGNQPLALAYTTHVMDIYDHYRWRFMIQQQKQHAWTGLQTTPAWQDKYFQPGNMAYLELEFWTSGAIPSAGIASDLRPPVHAAPTAHAVAPPADQPVGPLRIPVPTTPATRHANKAKRRTDGERRPRT